MMQKTRQLVRPAELPHVKENAAAGKGAVRDRLAGQAEADIACNEQELPHRARSRAERIQHFCQRI